jgi:hypothetical protein
MHRTILDPVLETTAALEERLRRVVALHFDPRDGSAYWLQRAVELKLDAVGALRTIDDLARLGPMDKSALQQRPVEDFVPRKFHALKREWIVGETGGTLGRSSFAVHREDEFHAAFVVPFVSACRRVGFPCGLNWLFIGPSGPHVIGKAARACARALESMDPFSVDFDPRWARKLPPGSVARERYLAHIEAQALDVLRTQDVGVLFATPPVLESLAEKIEPARRAEIRGIHFGGMAVQTALREKLRDLFPNAVQISGYGNTLFGVAPELNFSAATGIDYFAHGTRLVYRVVDTGIKDECERISSRVDYDRRGQVLVHRLDETQFVPNMLERDSAVRVAPPPDAAADGFALDGLRDPQPIVDAGVKPALGLY